MKYWERWTGDWKRKTAHLSAEAKGIYGELLDHAYSSERPLPLETDELCRIAGAVTQAERKATERVVAEFFTKTDSGYVNKRAQEEIGRRQQYVSKQRESGRKGLEARLGRTVDASTGEIAPEAEKLNGAFVQFWNAYPKKTNRSAAESAWISLNPDEALAAKIIRAVAAQRRADDWNRGAGRFIPLPAKWITERRWEDEALAVASGERPSIVCDSCQRRVFTWTGSQCDMCWRKSQGLA